MHCVCCVSRYSCHSEFRSATKTCCPWRGKPPLNSLTGMEGFCWTVMKTRWAVAELLAVVRLSKQQSEMGIKKESNRSGRAEVKRQDRMCVHSVRRQSRLWCLCLFPVTWIGPIRTHLSPFLLPLPLLLSYFKPSDFSAHVLQVRASLGSELSRVKRTGLNNVLFSPRNYNKLREWLIALHLQWSEAAHCFL